MPLTEDEKEELQTAELFAPLLKLPGWRAYLALLDHHIESKKTAVCHPVVLQSEPFANTGAVDRLIALEADKGAIVGLRLAREAVDGILARAAEIRKKMSPEDEE